MESLVSLESRTIILLSFTPGFSRVCFERQRWKPFKRFPLSAASDHLVKPVCRGKDLTAIFSVHPLCSLCLCGEFTKQDTHHRGTENTEDAQRKIRNSFSRQPPEAGVNEKKCFSAADHLAEARYE
jgi:hypothetical protein